MNVDPATLMILTEVLALTIGLLLLSAWAQNRDYVSLALYGAGYLVCGAGAVLLMARNHVPDFLSINLANAVLFSGYGLMWAGARAFAGGRAQPAWIAIGPVAWLVACSIPIFARSDAARVLLASFTIAAYTLATARELWRSDGEPLTSRYPTVAWLLVHASVYLARLVAALIWPVPIGAALPTSLWFVAMTFESMVHLVAFGFLVLSMAKERSERVQQLAASTDELTGAASRGAFLRRAERDLRAALGQGRRATLMLFDLDHFKSINDRYGHDAGDQALRTFARCARATLRPDDLFGRVGGEEFAALLVGADAEAGVAVAERVRKAVEAAGLREDGGILDLSVSIGVTDDAGAATELGDMMKQADRALYAAKAEGRNRVHHRGYRPVPHLRAV
jgi:diguanylate cyclase (GGDEF)-like protein